MTNDDKTSYLGYLAVAAGGFAMMYPGLGEGLKQAILGVGGIALLFFSYYTNKHDAPPPPPPPPDPALVKAIAEQLKAMLAQMNTPKAA